MIKIVNVYITRTLTEMERLTGQHDDKHRDAFKQRVLSQQGELDGLLDEGFSVLHAGESSDWRGAFVHFVLYKPTHLVKLDQELDELNAAMNVTTKPGNGHPPTDPDTYSDDQRFTLTDEARAFLDQLDHDAGIALD